MPFYDFFRGLFGLPKPERYNQNPGFRRPIGPGSNDDDDDSDDDDNVIIIDDDEYRQESPFGFSVFSGNMQDMHRHFQQQVDEIMKTFDSPWFSNSDHSSLFGIPNDENIGAHLHRETIRDNDNPRNKFLKPPTEPKNDYIVPKEEDKTNDILIPHDRNGGGFLSRDPLEIHKFFEAQFDNIMKRFLSPSWFSIDEGNRLDVPNETPGRVEQFVHPRNKFFKPSYEQPHNNYKADTDIDNESYAPKVIGKLLDKEPAQPPNSSIISRSMVTTHQRKMLPNGGIEERRKCIRDGKEEVIVSRQLGDLKHIVTTVKLPDGTTTKNEEFINFDQGQLGDFNSSWNKM